MSFCEVKKFEGGIKVGLDFIDPAHEVYTWLPEENKWRFCGSIDFSDGLLFMKRWRRHQHHILNSFGISAYVIEFLEPKGLKNFALYIEDTKESFTLTLEKLKLEATWKYWKEGGYDRQAFVPITLWEKKH